MRQYNVSGRGVRVGAVRGGRAAVRAVLPGARDARARAAPVRGVRRRVRGRRALQPAATAAVRPHAAVRRACLETGMCTVGL